MLRYAYSLALIFILTGGILNAQQRTCATMDVHEKLMATDPQYEARQQELEQFTSRFIASGGRSTATVTIPVVFHILYSTNNSTQNISTQRILDQIAVLNADFTATNSDISQVPLAFQPLIGNSNIQFCLAQRDPNGNATDGILRISTSTTSFSSNDNIKFTSSGGHNAWPRDQYLNIWVGNLSGGLLGYAQFPGGTASTDGVVVLNGSVGGPNYPGTTGNYNLGRTATHEIGHWLNLRHIWGDANCGNDQVADTPTQQTSNSGCPSFPHITCSNGPNGDMFMNYMDYVYDNCMVMFSAGQCTRMNAAITSSRSTLLTSLGCVSPMAAPVAAFQATSTTVCKYDQVSFTDLSTNNPTSWNWSFPGGTPSTSSSQNPVVAYNSTGTYDVSLTATNAGGSDGETISGYITVLGLPQVSITSENNSHTVCAGSTLTLTANLSSNNQTYQWIRYGNPIPGAVNQTYDVTKTGNYKVMVTKPNGCSKTTGNFRVDKVPVPVVTISPNGPTTFCQGDDVVLNATVNPTWTYSWKKYSNIIAGETGNSLTVDKTGKYKAIVVDANGCQGNSNKITVNVNCRLSAADGTISLYPNPATDQITINFNYPTDAAATLLVYDALGKKVMEKTVQADQMSVDLSIDALHEGIYTIQLSLEDGVLVKRFVKQ